MAIEQCLWKICFVPLNDGGQKFFGFSEFLTGLALMVIAWTIADTRYRFRVQTAPIPLLRITFSIMATVGVMTLLTDLWRSEHWLVPKGDILTPGIWQAFLGALFLLTFFIWLWFACIRPPIYGRCNANRFLQVLYYYILKGSREELAVIADELTRSTDSIIFYATNERETKNYRPSPKKEQKPTLPKVEGNANGLLQLIADKRLCRAIVQSSQITALGIFQAMLEMKKYDVPVKVFAKNVVTEALTNKDSFLYHETEGYDSGLIGYHKPLSQVMFANYEMVEAIGRMFDPDYSNRSGWDADQWKAYCRVVLMTFQDYVQNEVSNHSVVLYRAIDHIKDATSDLYKLNESISNSSDNDAQHRLRVVMSFVKDMIKILDEKGVPNYVRLRVRETNGHPRETFYDHIASMIFEIIFNASAVKSPRWECWSIQHNAVWFELFNFDHSLAGKVIKFKLRRLLYDEIIRMKDFPNFKGAKILGFCLNVMGFTVIKENNREDSRALQKAMLSWIRKNYIWLHEYNPRIAEACLVDGITYDANNRRLVRTSTNELEREPKYFYFNLDSAPES